MDFKAGIYRHYKGGFYQAIGIGAHSETHELMVVYFSVKPAPNTPHLTGPRMRIRPLSIWGDVVEGFDGTQTHRFEYVGLEIPE